MASGPFGMHERADRPSSPVRSNEEEGILSYLGITYMTELIMGAKMCGGFRDKGPLPSESQAGRPRDPADAGPSVFPSARGEDDRSPPTTETAMYGRRGNKEASSSKHLSSVLEDHLQAPPARGRDPLPPHERSRMEDSLDQTMPGRYGSSGRLPEDRRGGGGSSAQGYGERMPQPEGFGGSGRAQQRSDSPPPRDPRGFPNALGGRDEWKPPPRPPPQDAALGSGNSSAGMPSALEEYERLRANQASKQGDARAPPGGGAGKLNTSFNSVPMFTGPPPQSADAVDMLDTTRRMPPQSRPKEEPRAAPPPAPAAPPAATAAGRSKAWEWPEWAMDRANPCIEVYVEDEDTKDSRWVLATPQSRLVNKQGHDTFLTVQYEWDGEIYDQEFEPHHVRRRGSAMTIKEMIDSGMVGQGMSSSSGSKPTPPPPAPKPTVGAGVDLDSTSFDRSLLDKTVLSKDTQDPTASTKSSDMKGKLAELKGKFDNLLHRSPDKSSPGGAAGDTGSAAGGGTGGSATTPQPGAARGKPAGHWEWPAWCLNSKMEALEVFVEDDETGETRWLKAVPVNRVVDNDGNDAFVSAQYDWDGEEYVQDFAPEHVRKRGGKATVQDMIKSGKLE